MIHQHSAHPDLGHLAQPTPIGGDQRQPAGHRLDGAAPQPLPIGEQRPDVGGGIECSDVVVAAEQAHPILHPELADQAAQRRLLSSAAGQYQVGRSARRQQFRHGSNEQVLALARVEEGGLGDYHPVVADAQQSLPQLTPLGLRAGPEVLQVGSVVDALDPCGRDQIVAAGLGGQVVGDGNEGVQVALATVARQPAQGFAPLALALRVFGADHHRP
ncbi:hypothetical protein SAMN05892883_0006 [Jatrophihabitans sp. GAS493]|nr:hypothetical protein [Jatrophihabitans sp. GAS493]SOD70273.1 hypothetical protein SAMN05892883_0006 [Jatrophihabitans sp. GAS493]